MAWSSLDLAWKRSSLGESPLDDVSADAAGAAQVFPPTGLPAGVIGSANFIYPRTPNQNTLSLCESP